MTVEILNECATRLLYFLHFIHFFNQSKLNMSIEQNAHEFGKEELCHLLRSAVSAVSMKVHEIVFSQ